MNETQRIEFVSSVYELVLEQKKELRLLRFSQLMLLIAVSILLARTL